MKMFKKVIALSLLLMITVASTIPVSAKVKYIEKEVINVGGCEYTQKVDGGYNLIYTIDGDERFDKAELAVKIWYKDGGIVEHKFDDQTFRNTSFCRFDDDDEYRQINGLFEIIRVKVWCKITKDGDSKQNTIYLNLD